MRLLLILFIIIVGSVFTNAQNVNTGFSMLNNAPTPNSLSLNEATTGNYSGAGALYQNPALLVNGSSSTLDFAYSSWMDDTKYIFGGANFIQGKRAFALGIYNSKIDGFEQRNNPGGSNGDFSISYLSITGGLAYDFDILSVGISGQFLNEENFQYQASGYAFNFGLASEFFDSRLKTGISLLNIGSMDNLNNKPTQLPEQLRAGISVDVFRFAPPKNSNLPILVSTSFDYVNPLHSESNSQIGTIETSPFFNVGLRFNVAEVVELSTGYKSGETTKPWAFGAGFITDLLNIHYSIIPYETGFGTLHSIGLQYKF